MHLEYENVGQFVHNNEWLIEQFAKVHCTHITTSLCNANLHITIQIGLPLPIIPMYSTQIVTPNNTINPETCILQ